MYGKLFYNNINKSSSRSANKLVPFLYDKFRPKSIADFGCGRGIFVNEFLNLGCDSIGLDDEWVKDNIEISLDNYISANLGEKIELKRKFDLVISLEVAEHIDKIYADVFIDNLCRHSDLVVFSAAIPGQGGTGHINEQWQSYWANKFVKRGYYPDNSLRMFFWNDSDVDFYYSQNTIIYKKQDNPNNSDNIVFDVVHPKLFSMVNYPYRIFNKFVPNFIRNIILFIYQKCQK